MPKLLQKSTCRKLTDQRVSVLSLWPSGILHESCSSPLSTAIAMYTLMAMTFWLPQTEAALAQVEWR